MPHFIKTMVLFILYEEYNEETVSKHLVCLIAYQISVGSLGASKSKICDVNLWNPLYIAVTLRLLQPTDTHVKPSATDGSERKGEHKKEKGRNGGLTYHLSVCSSSLSVVSKGV